MAKKKIIGYTITSSFQDSVREMIEHEDGLNSIALIVNQDKEDDLTQVLNICDALVFSGGVDLSPMNMGEELFVNMGYSRFDSERDLREMFMIKWARENQKRGLFLCRGHQLLGVSHQLNLIPSIEFRMDGNVVCHNPGKGGADIQTGGEPIHFVECLHPFKEEFFDKELANSWHRQALEYDPKVNYLEYGIEVIGTSHLNYCTDKKKEYKIIELMRTVDGLFLGSQFHSELRWQDVASSAAVVKKFKEMIEII